MSDFVRIDDNSGPIWVNVAQVRAFWGAPCNSGSTRMFFDYQARPEGDSYTNEAYIDISLPPEEVAVLIFNRPLRRS